MKFNYLITNIILLLSFASCGQKVPEDSIVVKRVASPVMEWKSLAAGVSFTEFDAPIESAINDSKISILKLDPALLDFYMLAATEHENEALPANEWAEKFDLNIVINAGMYDLAKKLSSKGLLKNETHVNNGSLYANYNAMIAFNPIDSNAAKFTILDLKCTDWNTVKSDYSCYAQGLRMIDCDGKAIEWNKKKQSCSMLVTAKDQQGNIYFIFSRSAYSHNEMIGFMLGFNLGLTNAIYMEGGPQTSIYVSIGDMKIEKIGSYVSETYPNDLNDHFWKLPNVIGVKVRK